MTGLRLRPRQRSNISQDTTQMWKPFKRQKRTTCRVPRQVQFCALDVVSSCSSRAFESMSGHAQQDLRTTALTEKTTCEEVVGTMAIVDAQRARNASWTRAIE